MKILRFVLALTLAGVSGCNRLPPSKPLNELTPEEAAGRRVFLDECSRCHYPDSERALNGPGLEGLFRRPYLPSGGIASDSRVIEVIERGRNMMPAFGNRLDEEQLEALMAYLHTL